MPNPHSLSQDMRETLQRMHLYGTSIDHEFQDILLLANELAETPVAFIAFGAQDEQRLLIVGQISDRENMAAKSIADALLISLGDHSKSESFRPFLRPDAGHLESGGFSFAGMRLHAGPKCLGSLWVMMRGCAELTERQLSLLTALGRQLCVQLENRWQVTMQTTLNNRLVESLARVSDRKGDAMLAASRLDALFRGLPMACFTFDLELNVREWNWSAEKLFGIAAHEAADRPIHEVLSNNRMARRLEPIVDALLKGLTVSAVEWTYHRADGKRLRIATSAFPVVDQHREIVGVVSAHVDLTAQRENELALRASETRLKNIIDSMRDGVILRNRQGKITVANASASRILGISQDAMLTNTVVPEDQPLNYRDGTPLTKEDYPPLVALKDSTAIHDQIIGFTRPDGSKVWVELDATPLQGEGPDSPSSIVTTFSDISSRVENEAIIEQQFRDLSDYSLQLDMKQVELEEANRRLEALATTDGLTTLMNHRTFQDTLEREVRLSVRNEVPISLIFLDIDCFKLFNDRFGHRAGDEVLAGVAFALRDTVRETDIVARYGGEEMVVVLPNTDYQGATMVAEKLRSTLEDADWPNGKVTASFGVSTLPKGVIDRQVLIEQADRALYFAKATGKNRVSHYLDVPKGYQRIGEFKTECA